MVLNGNHKGEKCLIKENHCLSSDENTADFWKKYEADLAECQETKVVHMGDIGCMMDDVSKLKNCDVLMIPIGGYYTIDTKEALKYIAEKGNIFVIVQFAVNQFGYSNSGLSAKKLISDALDCEYTDAAGLNCGVGPGHMLSLIHI